MISTLTHEDPFNAVKRSAANTDALPGTDERMWQARNLLAYRFPEALDLFIWNRSPLSFTSYETKHAWRSQYL
jgi:hypothetical protein